MSVSDLFYKIFDDKGEVFKSLIRQKGFNYVIDFAKKIDYPRINELLEIKVAKIIFGCKHEIDRFVYIETDDVKLTTLYNNDKEYNIRSTDVMVASEDYHKLIKKNWTPMTNQEIELLTNVKIDHNTICQPIVKKNHRILIFASASLFAYLLFKAFVKYK